MGLHLGRGAAKGAQIIVTERVMIGKEAAGGKRVGVARAKLALQTGGVGDAGEEHESAAKKLVEGQNFAGRTAQAGVQVFGEEQRDPRRISSNRLLDLPQHIRCYEI